MPNQKKKGALLGYANVIAKNLVNLIYVPLLLHFLGQSDYGVFQMTNSVVFALTLLSAGFYGSYVRFYMRERAKGGTDTGEGIRKLNGIFLLVYVVVAILCLIGGLLMVAYVRQLFRNGLTAGEINLARILLVIMSVNIAVTLFSTPFDSYIIAHEQFVFQQSRQLLTSLAQPFLALVLLWLGTGAIGVACAQLIISTVLLLLNIVFATRRLRMRFTFTNLQWIQFKAIAVFSFWILLNQIFDLVNNNVPNFLLGAMASAMRFTFTNLQWIQFKAIAVFSFWILLNQIFDLVNNNVPNFLLGAMASASAVTVFSIALQIRNLFFSMSTTMSGVFVPQINRLVAETDNNDQLLHLMTRVGRYQMILFWYLFGGFIVVGQYFVYLWAGAANADAYWLCLIMVLPVMIPLTQNTGIEIQRAKNKHKARSLIYVLTAVLDIVISVLLIPHIGYWATAIGYTISILLGTGLFMNWYYHRSIGLNMLYFWKHQLPTIGVAIASIAICLAGTRLLPIHSTPTFIIWGVAYTLLFGAGAMYLGLTADERVKMLQIICRKDKHA